MGCDIHASIEARRHRAWWVHVADMRFLPRDYRMFSVMVDGHSRDSFGVGGVVPERGKLEGELESDTSIRYDPDHVLCAAVALGDHTFSWMTPAEYRGCLARYRDAFGLSPDTEWLALGAYLDALEAGGAVRLVFSFDN